MPQRPKIEIAATFTAEPLSASLNYLLEQANIALDVNFTPYNQVFQELISNISSFARNTHGVNLLLIRIEDFVRNVVDDEVARESIPRIVEELSSALGSFASRTKVPTIVALVDPSPTAKASISSDLEYASRQLSEYARTLPSITLLSTEEINLVSEGEPYDEVSDELGHIPFTPQHFSSLALSIVRKIHALRVPAQKVLVLDCDNTLWKGVVGEDGIDGIAITPAFACVQRFAIKAHDGGALICLASKNVECDVLQVFEKRADMLLRVDHLVAHRINWQDKATNIVSLARALNLGLDSFVFLDDSPVECALMRTELPEVITFELPPEDQIESFLDRLWVFDKVSTTEEDIRRTQMYKEDSARREFETSAIDIRDFIASLEVVIDIRPPNEMEWPRLSQLTQRTNQFNFTTVRRTEAELRSIDESDFTILRVNVQDRFGDYGLVGVVIVANEMDRLSVDTLLLSCRVLGRGVEHAIMRELGVLAEKQGLPNVAVTFVPTAKNEPARAFLESVVSQFGLQDDQQVCYCIPSNYARLITHRPGEDSDAVIEASRPAEPKAKLQSPFDRTRSERYSALAKLKTGRVINETMASTIVRKRSLQTAAIGAETETEQKMLELWQQALGIAGLGVDDDYFSVGGTSLQTVGLFSEIARHFGTRLPLTTIMTSPTVRALSRQLDTQSRFSSLVELKPPAEAERKLFLVHDGDGETLLYSNLARRLPEEIAVFGIGPHNFAGVPLAHTRIEDMAGYCIERMRERQPYGPYIIGGMCAGGVIAHEMANQLIDSGEEIEFVLLLDAATPQAARYAGRVTKQRLGRLRQLLSTAHLDERSRTRQIGLILRASSAKIRNALFWEIKTRWKKLAIKIRFLLLQRLSKRRQSWPKDVPSLTARQIYECAEAKYKPRPISKAKIVLVRATSGEGGDTPYHQIYSDSTLGWGSIDGNLMVVDVCGGHFSMLQEPFVADLAKTLESLIAPKRPYEWISSTKQTASA